MKVLPSWKEEVIALVNKNNGLSLTVDDVSFSFVSREDGYVKAEVTPLPDSRYYSRGKVNVLYAPRDLAKNFTGIPLRVIVQEDTTVRKLVEDISLRYGIPFDYAVDFTEEQLNKNVTFTDTGIKDVTVPAAEMSYVWVGSLTFSVANDTLDLVNLIKNTAVTNLKYLVDNEQKAAIQLATLSLDWVNTFKEDVPDLSPGDKLPETVVTSIVNRLVKETVIPTSEKDDVKTLLLNAPYVETTELDDKTKLVKFGQSEVDVTGWDGTPMFMFGDAPLTPINLATILPTEADINGIESGYGMVVELRNGGAGCAYVDIVGLFAPEGLDGVATKEAYAKPFLRRFLASKYPTDDDIATAAKILRRWNNDNVEVKTSTTLLDTGEQIYRVTMTGKNALTGTVGIAFKEKAIPEDKTISVMTAATFNPVASNFTKPESFHVFAKTIDDGTALSVIGNMFKWVDGKLVEQDGLERQLYPVIGGNIIAYITNPHTGIIVKLIASYSLTNYAVFQSPDSPEPGRVYVHLNALPAATIKDMYQALMPVIGDTGVRTVTDEDGYPIDGNQYGTTTWGIKTYVDRAGFVDLDTNKSAFGSACQFMGMQVTTLQGLLHVKRIEGAVAFVMTNHVRITDNDDWTEENLEEGLRVNKLEVVFKDCLPLDIAAVKADPSKMGVVFGTQSAYTSFCKELEKGSPELRYLARYYSQDANASLDGCQRLMHALVSHTTLPGCDPAINTFTKTVDDASNAVYTITSGLLTGFTIKFKATA